MDEYKNTRGDTGDKKLAPDPHNKPAGEKRQSRRGKYKNTRSQNSKSAADTRETKKDTIESQTGKNQSKNAKNCYEGGSRHTNGERARNGKQSQKPSRSERRQNANHSDKTHEKNSRSRANSQKQNENRSRRNRSSQNKSNRNESPESIPPNVIDIDTSALFPDYLMSPYLRKTEPQPGPDPEPEFGPGEYKFPDDTGQIVFGDPPEEKPQPEQPAEPVEMVEIVDVRFKLSGKTYFFSPNGLALQKDDNVIVETARGLEFGTVVMSNRFVPVTEIVPPLKNVLRMATPEDEERKKANEAKEIDAFNICLQKIEEHGLDMKLVDVEYTFDNSKLLFYFSADGRVDFRELARDLASIFRTRIELRQIGIRDEAKMLGGIGICGRPLCCTTFLSEFGQVSIKMAKEQNLSLNSSKISGTCGRLMCCLRYEYNTYVEELAKTPRVDTLVETPDGIGVVTEISPLAGLVKVRLQDNPDQSPRYYNRADLKEIAPPPSAEEEASGDAPAEENGYFLSDGSDDDLQTSEDSFPDDRKAAVEPLNDMVGKAEEILDI